jgi:pimeloyl-ACP methyl ester carboxylesterase
MTLPVFDALGQGATTVLPLHGIDGARSLWSDAASAAIRLPTLCLAAEHDRTAPPEVIRRLAARVAGAEFVRLPHAGHIAPVEVAAAFNAAVLSSLQHHFAL